MIVSAAELLFSTFSPRQFQSTTVQSARFIPMARKGGDTLLQLLPASLQATILEQALKVEQQVNSKVMDHLHQAIPGGDSTPNPSEAGKGGAPLPQNYPQQHPSPNMPTQGHQQGHQQGNQGGSQLRPQPGPQMVQPQVIQQQGGQVPSGMVVIRPSQPGSTSMAPTMAPPMTSGPNAGNGQQMSGAMSSPTPSGLGQSAFPQDTQSAADRLAQLKPQSVPSEDSGGYTPGQRSGMDRLLQTTEEE